MTTAEQIIAEHPWSWELDDIGSDIVMCKCGEVFASPLQHAAHVVAALTNAGKAIVDLPEADAEDDDGGPRDLRWDIGPSSVFSWTAGSVSIEGALADIAPEAARRFGAALLAAARVAEGGERGE
ncbi:hypothetical protein GS580_16600 [Rhodococcus hoagii]|nr:hypothetical protein [Prescottella equi]